MKRKNVFIILSLILSLFLISGCESNGNSNGGDNLEKQNVEDDNKDKNDNKENDKDKNNQENEEKSDISSYYPLKENIRYIYKGEGNEYAPFTSYMDYKKGNRAQYRIDNSGTVLAEIIEVTDNEIRKVLSKGEVYYREDLLGEGAKGEKDKPVTEVLLKAPIKEGNSWELEDGSVRTITNISADVSTPLGDYKAIEVTTKGQGEGKTIDYYAKDVGLVKTIFVSNGMEVSSTIEKIEEDAKLTQKIRFFYPNVDDERLHYIERDVEFKTNDVSRIKLEEAYKNALKDKDAIALTKNTKINYLYLNQDGMVYIDLSKDFVEEMNAGSGYESQILDSVATTFGYYYGAKKVVLTIDGGDYESGHIILEKGDHLEVRSEDAVSKD